jgi:hypothetical protein
MRKIAITLTGSKFILFLFLCVGFLSMSVTLNAQVTTSSIVGLVVDENNEPLIGATVLAIHTPSGSTYGTVTNTDGRFIIPNMRIGGPYQVTTSYVGYNENITGNIFLNLGVAGNVNVKLQSGSVDLAGIEVTATRNDVFSSDRTGAATNVTSQQLSSFPTLSRRLSDFTRLTPQAGGGNSFAGQDNRLNNITIDGSLFNNSFGLAGEPGGRTGTAPISLDAIEEVQVNIAPYDVRQSGFVGAGINAVTRSGTNEFSGSVFYNLRNENLTGNKAAGATYDRALSPFDNTQLGFRLGGPIIKNKVFFFVNAELENNERPYLERSNSGNDPVEGQVTRVLRSDLERVSALLNDFGYQTGPFEGYNLNLKGNKFLAKLDFNINNNNKVSLRYNLLDSENDILVSNSSSLGFGARRQNGRAMSYQNSNYIQFEKINSVIGEWNSIIGTKMSNNLILGFTNQNENRGSRGSFFPLVEIQQGGQTYISAGFEPFTPANQLEYKTYQLINNLSIYLNKHTVTAGISAERLEFKNVFFPGSQGVFVYNSTDDFFTDLNDAKSNPNRTTSPVSLRRFQYRYANGSLDLPVNEDIGVKEPVQPTKVWYTGIYVQDEWAASSKFNLTAGLRVDVPIFDETGFENPTVAQQTYLDGLRVSTAKLPNPSPLFSPRLGFNFDPFDDKSLQIRGGTGIFTGRPAFVWISNQIGNNGVLTGFEQIDNTNTRPFTTNPAQFIADPNRLPTSFELALTDENFKFPQVWRSNLAIDKKLPGNLVATLEFIYNQDVNGISYLNINEEPATRTFTGVDNRPRYAASGLSGTAANNAIRINDNVVNAIYLTNQNQGRSYNIAVSLDKQFGKGLFMRTAYAFGEAKNLVDPGSIAAGSWNGIASVNGNNRPDLAFSNNDLRHRVLGAVSYRIEYFNFGATSISIYANGSPQGRFTYVYNQDMNGDVVNGNDLMFVPNNANQIRFLPITTGTGTNLVTVFTPEQQQAAYEAYINQDSYLSSRRGQYTERNGAILPWLWNVDLSIAQDLFTNIGGKRNTLQARFDILNFTNMLNEDWGVGNRVINTRPLTFAGVTAEGEPQFRMVTTGSGTSQQLLSQTLQKSFDTTNFTTFWRAQFGVRYIFN